jgi:hypothetical protein
VITILRSRSLHVTTIAPSFVHIFFMKTVAVLTRVSTGYSFSMALAISFALNTHAANDDSLDCDSGLPCAGGLPAPSMIFNSAGV